MFPTLSDLLKLSSSCARGTKILFIIDRQVVLSNTDHELSSLLSLAKSRTIISFSFLATGLFQQMSGSCFDFTIMEFRSEIPNSVGIPGATLQISVLETQGPVKEQNFVFMFRNKRQKWDRREQSKVLACLEFRVHSNWVPFVMMRFEMAPCLTVATDMVKNRAHKDGMLGKLPFCMVILAMFEGTIF